MNVRHAKVAKSMRMASYSPASGAHVAQLHHRLRDLRQRAPAMQQVTKGVYS
jgi:hypothetical protein